MADEAHPITKNTVTFWVFALFCAGLVGTALFMYKLGEGRATDRATAENERLRADLAEARAASRRVEPSMQVPVWARQVHWHWQISLASKDDAETKFAVTTSMYRPDKRGAAETGLDASDNEAAFDRAARTALNRWLGKHPGCRFEEPVPGRAVVAAVSHDGAELATTFATTVICPSNEMTDVLRDPFSGIRADLDRVLRNPQEILREATKLEKEEEARQAATDPTGAGGEP